MVIWDVGTSARTNAMWLRLTGSHTRTLKGAAFAAVLSIFVSAGDAAPAAAASGPFAALAGSWSGSGTISVSNGTNERIRCRATYNVLEEGRSAQLSLRCASDSYNFNLLGNVRYEGGAVSGSWAEATRNVSGAISGRASGSQILVTAQAASFAANLLLVTRGNRQSVSIRAAGGDITGVDIALSRK
jgi:hypothetical protein